MSSCLWRVALALWQACSPPWATGFWRLKLGRTIGKLTFSTRVTGWQGNRPGVRPRSLKRIRECTRAEISLQRFGWDARVRIGSAPVGFRLRTAKPVRARARPRRQREQRLTKSRMIHRDACPPRLKRRVEAMLRCMVREGKDGGFLRWSWSLCVLDVL